jgi:hypothetical protein
MEIPARATTEQKLDLLLEAVGNVLKSQANLEKLVSRVSTLEATVAAQQTHISSLTKEVRILKDQANTWDQMKRANTLCLFNFPCSDGDANLTTKVYDRVLKPILVAAKAKGDISSVPNAHNCLEAIFRAGKPAPNKPPPPIIIKLTSHQLRLGILLNKKTSMPTTTEAEKSAGCRRFIIVEDLTPPTHKKLKELAEDDRVEKAWTVEGQIRFVLKEGDKSVLKVKSVYDPISTILPV